MPAHIFGEVARLRCLGELARAHMSRQTGAAAIRAVQRLQWAGLREGWLLAVRRPPD